MFPASKLTTANPSVTTSAAANTASAQTTGSGTNPQIASSLQAVSNPPGAEAAPGFGEECRSISTCPSFEILDPSQDFETMGFERISLGGMQQQGKGASATKKLNQAFKELEAAGLAKGLSCTSSPDASRGSLLTISQEGSVITRIAEKYINGMSQNEVKEYVQDNLPTPVETVRSQKPAAAAQPGTHKKQIMYDNLLKILQCDAENQGLGNLQFNFVKLVSAIRADIPTAPENTAIRVSFSDKFGKSTTPLGNFPLTNSEGRQIPGKQIEDTIFAAIRQHQAESQAGSAQTRQIEGRSHPVVSPSSASGAAAKMPETRSITEMTKEMREEIRDAVQEELNVDPQLKDIRVSVRISGPNLTTGATPSWCLHFQDHHPQHKGFETRINFGHIETYKTIENAKQCCRHEVLTELAKFKDRLATDAAAAHAKSLLQQRLSHGDTEDAKKAAEILKKHVSDNPSWGDFTGLSCTPSIRKNPRDGTSQTFITLRGKYLGELYQQTLSLDLEILSHPEPTAENLFPIFMQHFQDQVTAERQRESTRGGLVPRS